MLQSFFASPTIRFAPPRGFSRRDHKILPGYLWLLALALAWAMLSALGLRAQTANNTSPNTATPNTATLNAAWTPLGPQSITSSTFVALTGRITALALDSNDPTANMLYVGTTGGGVWKSTNAADPLTSVTFAPLTDTLPVFNAGVASPIASLSIGALAVQPAANPVLLAGTGDPNDATDSYYGNGILRSTDGGLTWTLVQNSNDGASGNHSFAGLSVAAVAFSTTTPSLVVAAFSSALEGDLTGATTSYSVRGLYYSSDAGATWHMATIYDGTQLVQLPLPANSGGSNAATSVVWNPLRQRFFAAVRSHGFYESLDGITWTRLAAQPGAGLTTANCPATNASLNCPLFRGALAVQPISGDTYAVSVDASNNDNGLWQDLCRANGLGCAASEPAFAARIDNGALDTSGAIAQGDYNLTLTAAPALSGGVSATTLFVGTVDLYRCAIAANSSACALRNTTNALNGCNAPAMVAPAQHALASLTTTAGAPQLFLGNDGGLWRSLDGVAETGSVCSSSDASHFDNLNASIGSLAEVTGFAEHPTDANTLLVGLGANGSAATTAATTAPTSLTSWPQLSAGEGGYPLLDPANTNNWFAAIGAFVDVKACTLGSACTAANFVPPATIGETQVANDAALLDAATLLDPADTANLLVGTCRVWRGPATSSATWSAANAISAPFSGTAPCSTASPLIRTLAAGGPSVINANAQSSGSTALYAGLAGVLTGGTSVLGGHIFFTNVANVATNTTAWTDLALSPVTNDTSNAGVFNPFGYDISSIAVDAHDATGATVYATVEGFGGAGTTPRIYRSTDFGAHWLNVSNGLPRAPANAVLVDPNDANTVYVALDTGVYVTSAITTCATQNCWSVFGTSLPNSPAIALAAAPQMLTGDGRRGMLRAATYGRGIWQQPLLNAISIAQPAITLSTTSLTFAAQQVATQSAAQIIIVTSSGNSPVTISSVVIATSLSTIDFTETDNCAAQTLAVNATCTVSVVFAPQAQGMRTATLSIYANVTGGQATAVLSGIGTAPAAIVLTPNALSFPATLVNQSSAQQIITVANTGGNIATLQTPSLSGDSGDFNLNASTCTTTLAPQTSCSLGVIFTPTAAGARTGTLSITDSAGTQTAALSGSGEAPATDTLSATSLTFAQTTIGSTSPAQQIIITNSGDVALNLLSSSISGPFTVVNSCGASLAAKSTCALSVAFVPTASGAASGTLTITDQFRFQTVALSGIGVAPAGVSLTPTTVTFVAIGVGLTSPAQVVTLTNNGGIALTLTNISVSGDFQMAATSCGASLAVSANCNFTLTFTPTAGGARSGALVLTDNAPSGSQTVSLSGTAIDFALAANGPTSMTISSGASATYALLLTAPSGVSATAALGCTGAPANATCVVTPATPALSASIPVTVTVDTGVGSGRLSSPNIGHPVRGFDDARAIVLAVLFPLIVFGARRRRFTASLFAACFFAALMMLCGCGAGRQLPPSGITNPSSPTPSGTYTLTVSANSAGLAHSVALTLIVK